MPDVVPNNDLKTISTASTNGQAAFTYDFTCDNLAEMAVYHYVASTEAYTKLTHTTDYTVVAGTVTLQTIPAAAVVSGDKIVMQWEPVTSRAEDYAKSGSFTAAAINAELSRITNDILAIKRDLMRKLGGGVMFDGSFQLRLSETASDLYGKFLKFDGADPYRLVATDGVEIFPNESDPPNPATGTDGDLAYVGSGANKGQIYKKVAGAWVDQGTNMVGPQGDDGAPGLGTGDVVGPASAADNALARFDQGTGKLVQNSGVLLDDSDNMSGVNDLTAVRSLAGDGTTALPGISFSADPNTGFHRIGADSFGAYVNAGVAWFINSTRRVVMGEGPYSNQDVNAFCSVQHTGPAGTIGGNQSQGAWSNDTSSSLFAFTKSRNATKGSHTAVQSGDDIGEISFHGSDGTNFIKTVFITVVTDGAVSAGTVPMAYTLWTGTGGPGNQDIQHHVNSSGRHGFGPNVAPAANVLALFESDTSAEHTILARQKQTNAAAVYGNADHASFGSVVIQAVANRAGSAAFNLFQGWSNGFADKEFQVSGAGEVTADGSFTGGGADIAEMFRYADGNPSNEDRRGCSIVLEGAEIRIAKPSDDPEQIIGVISATPSLIGDAAWNKWSEKHLRDDFGTYIMEDYEVISWDEVVRTQYGEEGQTTFRETTKVEKRSFPRDDVPDGVDVPEYAQISVQQRRKVNPAFDPDQDYVARIDRPEWGVVGLLGKVRVRNDQVINPNWRKLRAISDKVTQYLIV